MCTRFEPLPHAFIVCDISLLSHIECFMACSPDSGSKRLEGMFKQTEGLQKHILIKNSLEQKFCPLSK